MKRSISWSGVSFTLAALVIAAGFTKVGAPNKPSSVDLLDESYNLLHQIDDSRQAFLLLPLTRVGAKLSAPQERDWCMTMFRQSLKVREPWDRVALEKNALVALSAVSAQAAMDLFSQVEEPVPDANDKYPEDVRADAASQIFPNYFDQQMAAAAGNAESVLQSIISDIGRETSRISKTGEYPYRASGKIIKKLEALKNHEAEINELFADAVKAYSEGKPKFRNRNAEFLVLLQNAKSVAVSNPSLYREGVRIFVQTVKIFQDDVNYEADFRTPDGTIIKKFTDRRQALLFNAFPIVREVDPQLAKTLMEADRDLGKATDDMSYVPAGVIEGNVKPQQAAAMHSRMQQISLLAQIRSKQQTDPLGAKKLAESLQDAQIRFAGLSITLPGLMERYPAQAKAVYDDQRTQLQEFTGDVEKGQALVAFAKSAAYVKEEQEFRAISGSAFDLLVGAYRQDYRQRPDLRPDLHKGYIDLREIVRFTASRDQTLIVGRIRQVQDDELKAHLLVFAAEGASDHN